MYTCNLFHNSIENYEMKKKLFLFDHVRKSIEKREIILTFSTRVYEEMLQRGSVLISVNFTVDYAILEAQSY